MKRLLVWLLLVALPACGGDDETDDTPEAAGTDTVAAARAPLFPEAEAVAVLRALGDVAAAQARAAREVSQNDDVLRYAAVVSADHRGIAELIKIEPRDNAMSTAIRANGDSITRALLALPGGFNNTYIEEQVRNSQQALAVLDTAVIPSVRDSATRTLLAQIRPTLAAHVQRAQQILAVRRQQAAERGEDWVSGVQRAAAPATSTPAPAAGTETAPATQQTQPAQQQPAPQRPAPTPRPAQPDTTPPPITTSNME